MKTRILNYVLSASVLILTCSFVEAPMSSGGYITEDAVSAIPVGGAFLMFAGKNGGEISKKEIAQHKDLKVDGCAAGARVLKFTLEVTKGGRTSSLKAEANFLNQEMLTKLKSLTSGDSFEFRHVTARLTNSNDVVDVHSRKFIVVEKGV